jgi:hypothetical protein
VPVTFPNPILCHSRFYFQDFVQFTKEDLLHIADQKEWMDPAAFEELLMFAHGDAPRKTLVVPSLAEGEMSCLRLKKVEKHDFRKLQKVAAASGFDILEFGGVNYIFGKEPVNLAHPHSRGVMVSCWGRDPLVTKLELNYEFARTRLAVFGNGFGDRETVPSHGTNAYAKFGGTGCVATKDSPAQAREDRGQHQYFREGCNHHLIMAPWARRQLNELSTNKLHCAFSQNPW